MHLAGLSTSFTLITASTVQNALFRTLYIYAKVLADVLSGLDHLKYWLIDT
jgi:hypothetical protein